MSELGFIEKSTMQEIADAVKEKEGSTDEIPVKDLAERILAIPTGTNKLPQVIDRTVTEITAEDLAGVTEIGKYAFHSCENLTGIILPNNITRIGVNAFNGCTNIKGVYINDIASWCNISFCFSGSASAAEYSNPSSMAKGKLYVNGVLLTELVLDGDKISKVSVGAFMKNLDLKRLIISGNPSIKDYTFYGSGLESVDFGTEFTYISNYMFQACQNLTDIIIPNSVRTIGMYALTGCANLTTVRIGNGINTINKGAFNVSATDIYIDKEEGSISGSPWGATNAQIHWNTPLPNLFQYTINEDGESYSVTSLINSSKVVVIPDTYEGLPVTGIDRGAFEGVESITSVIIPNSITSIGNCAFMHCNNLTSVTIPNSVTSIGENAFSYCDNLTSVTICDSMTKIGNNAFSMCNKLTDIYIYALPESINGSPWGATDAQIHWIMGD